jgi:hypothetical protein
MRRLRDQARGQIVNMFAQYLFLSRVPFIGDERIKHPNDAKAPCRAYLRDRCCFKLVTAGTTAERGWNVSWCGRGLVALQLMHKSLGGSRRSYHHGGLSVL